MIYHVANMSRKTEFRCLPKENSSQICHDTVRDLRILFCICSWAIAVHFLSFYVSCFIVCLWLLDPITFTWTAQSAQRLKLNANKHTRIHINTHIYTQTHRFWWTGVENVFAADFYIRSVWLYSNIQHNSPHTTHTQCVSVSTCVTVFGASAKSCCFDWSHQWYSIQNVILCYCLH